MRMDRTEDAQASVAQAVDQLLLHVDAQDRARQLAKDARLTYSPSDEDKEERDRLLRQLLTAIGQPKEQVLEQLGADRATWDRWKNMVSIPQAKHRKSLDRLSRRESVPSEDSPRPNPLKMLARNREHRTFGRLRLVYSAYDWNNAVFWFQNPFNDVRTATEMALLATRGQSGCSIVYLLAKPYEWGPRFIESLRKVLGKHDAARVLSRICVVRVPEERMHPRGYGVFNFRSEKADQSERVGYEYTKDDREGPSDKRPLDDDSGVYESLSTEDSIFQDLDDDFGEEIDEALEAIRQRREKLLWNLWEPSLNAETVLELLSIPVIELGCLHGDPITPS